MFFWLWPELRQARLRCIMSWSRPLVAMAMNTPAGTLMLIYMDSKGVRRPEKSDEIFGMIAFHSEMPVIVGILFVLSSTACR